MQKSVWEFLAALQRLCEPHCAKYAEYLPCSFKICCKDIVLISRCLVKLVWSFLPQLVILIVPFYGILVSISI